MNAGALFFALAATLLNYGIYTAYGAATPLSMTALSLSIVAFACGIVLVRNPRRVVSASTFAITLGACLAFQFVLLAMAPPPIIRQTVAGMSHYATAITLAGFLAGLMLMAPKRVEQFGFGGLVLTFGVTAWWLMGNGETPVIDVYVYQKLGAHNLFNGINPYSADYPNIYSAGETLANYGPNFADGDQLHYGYPYPPLALLTTALGECLFWDFRIGHAVALIGAAFFISRTKPSRWSFIIAALFLSSPMTFFILRQGWVEPVSFLLLAFASWCWFRAPRFFPFVFGALIVSKQYLILLVPLLLLLIPRPMNRRKTISFLSKIIASACAVTMPFALLDFPAFIHSIVLAHVRTPFRPDSMSYAIWFSQSARPILAVIAFGLCLVTAPMLLRFFKPGYKNFLIGLVISLFLFFAFNKQAFANYYYFVASAIWLLVSVVVAESMPVVVTPSIRVPRQNSLGLS